MSDKPRNSSRPAPHPVDLVNQHYLCFGWIQKDFHRLTPMILGNRPSMASTVPPLLFTVNPLLHELDMLDSLYSSLSEACSPRWHQCLGCIGTDLVDSSPKWPCSGERTVKGEWALVQDSPSPLSAAAVSKLPSLNCLLTSFPLGADWCTEF